MTNERLQYYQGKAVVGGEGEEVGEDELERLEGCLDHSLGVLRPQGADHGDEERPALGEAVSRAVQDLHHTVQLTSSGVK